MGSFALGCSPQLLPIWTDNPGWMFGLQGASGYVWTPLWLLPLGWMLLGIPEVEAGVPQTSEGDTDLEADVTMPSRHLGLRSATLYLRSFAESRQIRQVNL